MKRLFETDPTMEERFGQCPYATLSVQLKTLVENGLVEGKQHESIPPPKKSRIFFNENRKEISSGNRSIAKLGTRLY